MRNFIKKLLLPSFIIYLFALTFLLLARNNHYPQSLIDRIRYIANFVPFKTVIGFIVDAANGSVAPRFALRNIFGNLAAFLPMGFYLPCFFGRFRGLLKTVCGVYLIVLFFETVQILTGLGCFDVDDLILNVVGSIGGYGLFKLLSIHNVFEKTEDQEALYDSI